MENLDTIDKDLKEVVALLDEGTLPEVDFDRLRNRLSDLAEHSCRLATMRDELAFLREDYIARIAGMTKAIAAVGRRQSEAAQLLEDIEALPAMDAAHLVAEYRRAAARFRDAFPTSFGPLKATRTGLREPHQYK